VPGATPIPIQEVASELGRLRAPLGVVAVLGNHDWVEGGVEMASALRDAAVTVLQNEAVSVGRGLWVAGVADAGVRQPDLAAALAARFRAPEVALLELRVEAAAARGRRG
jgi:uncharacterized protein